MKMEQTECSETSAYKIQTQRITQKKAYNIQNRAEVWNQDYNRRMPLKCFGYLFWPFSGRWFGEGYVTKKKPSPGLVVIFLYFHTHLFVLFSRDEFGRNLNIKFLWLLKPKYFCVSENVLVYSTTGNVRTIVTFRRVRVTTVDIEK